MLSAAALGQQLAQHCRHPHTSEAVSPPLRELWAVFEAMIPDKLPAPAQQPLVR